MRKTLCLALALTFETIYETWRDFPWFTFCALAMSSAALMYAIFRENMIVGVLGLPGWALSMKRLWYLMGPDN